MSWYKKSFGKDYLTIYKHRDINEAAAFVEKLPAIIPVKNTWKILDLCCGGGRYSILFAQKEYHVVGLDLSVHLLDYAKKSAEERGLTIDFILSDMRNIPYTDYFHLVVNMFTSFGYFEKIEENQKVVRSIAQCLISGGWVIIDYLNKDYVQQNFQSHEETQDGEKLIIQERKIEEERSRITKKISIIEDQHKREYTESVAMYSYDQMERMLFEEGIPVISVFGDYDFSPFSKTSPRMILIGQKKRDNRSI